MKKYTLKIRTIVLFCIMLVIVAGLLSRLVKVQVIDGPKESQKTLTVTHKYKEIASRGEIYDKNGIPLVSNSLGFSVEVDYFNWDKTRQNDVILQLCATLSAADIPHSDELPMSLDPPYVYTFDSWEEGAGKALAKFLADKKDWPEQPDAPALFSLLCRHYGVSQDLLLKDKRTILGVRYYLDMRQFSAYNTPQKIAANVDIDTVAKLSERSLSLPGVSIQVDDVRQYDTLSAAHILGRVALISPAEYDEHKNDETPYLLNDYIGKEGMEKALESYLRGIDGVKIVEVSKEDGSIVSEFMETEPRPGNHCYLTLDLELQKVAEQALEDGLNEVREKGEKSKDKKGADVEGGAVVVLDAKTFEVLAMASHPTFDISRYSADIAANLQDPMKPLFNRAVQGIYPPGSTFKMATAVAALESGTATTQRRIRDLGVYQGFASADKHPACWIWNSRRSTHGNINISQALAYSCNYYFFQVAQEMTIEVLVEYASALGLGQKTGIELPYEKSGTLDGPAARLGTENPWYPGDVLSAAIGQGANQFSPLQLAVYMGTILNGGQRYPARLLKEVTDFKGEQVVYTPNPEPISSINLQESTVAAIKEGMRGVVTEDGTASSYFRGFPIEVGGKTGSAETQRGRSAHGVFISFAPYDEPEIIVVVIGEYAGTGGGMSPVCIDIYNHYFGIEPVSTPVTQPTQPPQTTLPGETALPPDDTVDPGHDISHPDTTDPAEGNPPQNVTEPTQPATEGATAPPEETTETPTHPPETTAPEGP